MQSVQINNTSLSISKFIFGTASLFNTGTAKNRNKLLMAAVDAGFTHFDTAPYYGFGLAETDLAPILKSHPNVTFTTKVGLYSPGGESQSETAVFIRKAAGRLIKSASRPIIDFSIKSANQTLEGSLRRTGRDTVDLYTLHEPLLPLVVFDEWQNWLESCVTAGKVRHFGLALTADKLEPFLANNLTIGNVIQLNDSLARREADLLALHGRPFQITYGYVSAALKAKTPLSIPEILKDSLRRNRDGAVIVSSSKIDRLAQYNNIIEEVRRDT